MEFASKLRWAIVIVIVFLSLVLFGWGLFSIANNLFRGGSSNDNEEIINFSSYEAELADSVSFTVDGPVIADQEHTSFTIEVNENIVTMRVLKSYGQTVVRQKSYQNTPEAYDTFLKALVYAGATSRLDGTTEDDDFSEQGVCAAGVRYIIEFDDEIRRWATSCSAKQGTSAASMRRTIYALFQKQVPDFKELRQGTRL